jgi:hypothetical protein
MSVYNPQTSQLFLEQLDTMSTDIRAQKKAIADALLAAQSAQGTANNAVMIGNTAKATADAATTIGNTAVAAADAAATAVQVISGTVQTISAEMVRKFISQPIDAASFVLDVVSGYYYATVSHMLGDAVPDVEVYDNDKDKQAIQSILVDNNTIKLELTAADMQSNAFPLTCICIGKDTSASAVAAWRLIPGSTTNSYRLLDSMVVESLDGGATINIVYYVQAEEAFLGTNNRIYAKEPQVSGPSLYWSHISGEPSREAQLTEAEYNAAKALPGTIVLVPGVSE